VKRPRITSQLATRIAFAVVVVFLLAQVTWWIIFQQRYIERVTQDTVESWIRDANTATQLYQVQSQTRTDLLEVYPHLRFEDEGFVIDPDDLQAFREEQTGHLRMFAFEGPFYALVILAGLYVIGLSLRAERDLKQRQQNFLNAVSHEFKTPISTLRLLVETALYRPLKPEKQRDYLSRMAREVTRLETMSEQILASARLEHAPLVGSLAPVELNEVVRTLLEGQRSSLEARGAKLSVVYTPEPLPVSLDAKAFGIVLGNLLDNAVKYTPSEEKPLRVRLERRPHLALVHIEDEGVGLKESDKARIFDPFYRVGDELTRESAGVGLGLHLVRSMTEAMNGWVRCDAPLDPQTGRGTRFTLVLPRRTGRAAVVPNAPTPNVPTPGEDALKPRPLES
jgi:two-component system sensor histidine kinase SenX3